MEWMLVALAVGLVVILVCDVADEVAYWWAVRRTAPHDGQRGLKPPTMRMRGG